MSLLGDVAGQVAIAVATTLAYQEVSALKDRLTEEKLYLEDEFAPCSHTGARPDMRLPPSPHPARLAHEEGPCRTLTPLAGWSGGHAP